MNRVLAYKLAALLAVVVVLIYALSAIEGKIYERQATRDQAVASIEGQYARAQQLVGPVLHLGCRIAKTRLIISDDNKREQRVEWEDCSRTVRPMHYTVAGGLTVNQRHRGIYSARVYLAAIRAEAQFAPLILAAGEELTGAHLVYGVSDARGIKKLTLRDAQGQILVAAPGSLRGLFPAGMHAALDLAALKHSFVAHTDLELAGSARLDIVPVGLENDIQLNSPWPHPSFVGRFLPDQTNVSAQGFTSRWRVSDLATGGDAGILSEKISGDSGERHATARHVNMSGLANTLGVSLLDPVDNYTQADRAVRYGFMFVLLTFGGFFLFEARKGQRIHSIQYLLVGFAVTLFFLLLVALSEHVAFAQAYLIAATACVGLLTAYGRYVLGHWGRAAVFGSAYVLFYGGMYVLLSSEDYAFLMGAWLVFGLLALAMFMTRTLDWHRFGETMVRRDAQETPSSESHSS